MKSAPLAQALALSLLITAAPLGAEEPKQQTRTLKEFVNTVLQNGADRTLKHPIPKNLGFKEDELHAKAVRYLDSQTPDKKTHTFYVLYKTSPEGSLAPANLIWITSKKTHVDSEEFIDAMNLKVSLDGVLEKAVSVVGKVGDTKHKQLSIKSKKVRTIFEHEKEFYVRDSLGLEYHNR